MDAWQVARIGTCASHFSAFIYSRVWLTMDEDANIATIISFALIFIGTDTIIGFGEDV